MEKDLKNVTNKELIDLYRLVLEHLEYLQLESTKVEENKAGEEEK